MVTTNTLAHTHAHISTYASLIVCAKFQFDGVYCSILTSSKRTETDKHWPNEIRAKNAEAIMYTTAQLSEAHFISPAWLANVCPAFSRIMQFMSCFSPHLTVSSTPQQVNSEKKDEKNLVHKQKSIQFFHYIFYHGVLS